MGVQVDALTRDIARDQDPHRRVRELELLHNRLLLVVRQTAVQHGKGLDRHAQGIRQFLQQPAQRRQPLAEQHDPGFRLRADTDLAEVADQLGQFRLARRLRLRRELAQGVQRGQFGFGSFLALPAIRDSLTQRCGRRKRGFRQRPGEQRVVGPLQRRTPRLGIQPAVRQLVNDLFLRGVGRNGQHLRLRTLRPVLADFVSHIGGVPMPPYEQVRDVFDLIIASIADRGGIQQAHQLGERFRFAVVRRGRGEHKCIGPRCQHPRQLIIQGAGVGQVMRFVDHHRIPVVLLQMRPVLPGFQRVDRDDHLAVVGERIAAGRQFLPDAFDSIRIQPHQWNREPGPQLVLHLLQDVAWRHDQDPFRAASPRELGQQHADFKRFSEPDGVRYQDPGPQIRPGQRLGHGTALVSELIQQHPVGNDQTLVVQRYRRLPQHRFQPQSRAPKLRRVIRHHLGFLRHQWAELIQVGQKRRIGVSHQLRHSGAGHRPRAILQSFRRPDDPRLVTDFHDRSRRKAIHLFVGQTMPPSPLHSADHIGIRSHGASCRIRLRFTVTFTAFKESERCVKCGCLIPDHGPGALGSVAAGVWDEVGSGSDVCGAEVVGAGLDVLVLSRIDGGGLVRVGRSVVFGCTGA